MAGITRRKVWFQLGPLVRDRFTIEKATDERGKIDLNMLHKACLKPINRKKVCSTCLTDGEPTPLTNDEVTSGYQYIKGSWIEITKADKDTIKLESSESIVVDEIVPEAVLFAEPIVLNGNAYWIKPDYTAKGPAYTFAVLAQTLKGYACIGRTVMYDREYTMAILSRPQGFLAFHLRYPSEIRESLPLDLPKLDDGALELAAQVRNLLVRERITLDRPDHYNEGFAAMVERKVSGAEVPVEVVAPVPVLPTGLVEQMRQQLAMAENQKVTVKPKASRRKAS